eukprot:m.111015 g.111015  ORF g.111015 m.111015 type:complete len:493 (-) comp12760_c6_seq1:777-2255(-)
MTTDGGSDSEHDTVRLRGNLKKSIEDSVSDKSNSRSNNHSESKEGNHGMEKIPHRGLHPSLATIMFLLGFVDIFSSGMMVPLFPSIIKSFGKGVAAIGFIGSLQGIAKLVAGPLFGWIIDRFGFKVALLLTLGMAGLAYLPTVKASSVVFVVMTKVLLGLFRQTTFVCETMITSTTPPNARASLLGKLYGSTSAGFIFGPIVGGQLAKYLGSNQLVAYLPMVMFLISSVLVYFYLEVPHDEAIEEKAKNPSKNKSWGESMRELKESSAEILQSGVINFFFVQLTVTMPMMMLRNVFPSFMMESYHLDSQHISFALSAQGVLGMIFSLFLGRLVKLVKGSTSLILPALCIEVVTYYLLFRMPSAELFLLTTVPLKLSGSVLRACVNAAVSSCAPHRHLGVLLGASQSVVAAGRTLAPSIAGQLLEMSPGHLAIGCALISFAGLFVSAVMPFTLKLSLSTRKTPESAHDDENGDGQEFLVGQNIANGNSGKKKK